MSPSGQDHVFTSTQVKTSVPLQGCPPGDGATPAQFWRISRVEAEVGVALMYC